jgi:HD superfamily phosphohydrolase
MPSAEVRDAVHGLIDLTGPEWSVVDTRAFQRLRGVAQLAMTHLVYPGARHSRAEHCIGACHVAGRLVKRLRDQGSAVDERRVRLAALCHDIGHGPFSHVSEFVYEDLTGRSKVHEQISAAIVRHDPAVRAALGDEDAEWIAGLLDGTGVGARRSLERDIVAGPADIDKLDYLLRDSLYCGVQYGKYDIAKVVHSAISIEVPGGGTQLAFHDDGIYALEEMLLARYHMRQQVYSHKTRVATDLMLVRAMRFGVDEEILPRAVFEPPEDIDAAWVETYRSWDDAEVTKLLLGRPNTIGGEVMTALVERRLLKRSQRYGMRALTEKLGSRMMATYATSIDTRQQADSIHTAEAQIAAVAGVAPQWVCLHWEDPTSPTARVPAPPLSGNDIMIVGAEPWPVSFTDRSQVFGAPPSDHDRFAALYVRPPNEIDGTWKDRVEEAFTEQLCDLANEAAQI